MFAFFLLTGPIVLRVSCWRFYRMSEAFIESGGFLRKKKRIFVNDVTEITTVFIAVFHGTMNLMEEVYQFSNGRIVAVVEMNEESAKFVNIIKTEKGLD